MAVQHCCPRQVPEKAEWKRPILPVILSISAPVVCTLLFIFLSMAPSVCLPLKLCPDRLHLPEADPAAVSAPDH